MMHGQRLLLVEDDAATREVLTLLLGAQGWQVDAVANGEAALACLSPNPAVTLCDLRLPGVCGEALAAALRRALCPGVVLLAMTASPRGGDDAGYDELIRKPFPAETIEAAWRRQSTGEHSSPATQATTLEDDAPVLDSATLEQLRQGMGDARVREFYRFALGDLGDRMERMHAAILNGDADTYTQQAHALKGSSGMMGARRLCQLASSAEMEGLTLHSPEKVMHLRSATEAVRLMLETVFPVEFNALPVGLR